MTSPAVLLAETDELLEETSRWWARRADHREATRAAERIRDLLALAADGRAPEDFKASAVTALRVIASARVRSA